MPSVADELDAYLQNTTAKDHFSGAVLVRKQETILVRKGFGQASESAPNTPETALHVGSVTKQFTATGILQLSESAKLDLEDPINDRLPSKYRSTLWAEVRVHHLLSHTSGIPDYGVQRSYYRIENGFAFDDTIEGMVHEAMTRELEFSPGTKFTYSNIGFTLLGLIIEEVSGVSYEDYIRARVLFPAGMESSIIHGAAHVPAPNEAQGYRWDNERNRLVLDDAIGLPTTPADGGLITTLDDFCQWAEFIMGRVPGILSFGSLQKMKTPGLGNNLYGRYGYGLFFHESFGNQRIHHPGHIVGFRSEFFVLPARETLVVVFANNTGTDPERIAQNLTRIVCQA